MSNLSKAERLKLDKSSFGDPDRRLYPIMDQSDVDAAARLIGKAKDPDAVKTRVMAIAKKKGLKLPEAWQEDAKHSASAAFEATFDGAPDVRDDVVIRTGKVFEFGDYPDKRFSLSPEEGLEVVANFSPAPIDLEHMSTVLDGKLGTLESVAIDDNGWDLLGELYLPRWLHDALGDAPVKVSGTFRRDTKQIAGLALVNEPRVPDAAVFAAFARHDTMEGQSTIQTIHDKAARAGAVCSPPADGKPATSYFVSAHELTGIQALHDTATQHGATCSALKDGQRPYSSLFMDFAAFAGRRHSVEDLKDLQAIHDLAEKQGAECKAPKESTSMSGKDPQAKDDAATAGLSADAAERIRKLEEQNASLSAAIANEQAKRIQSEATSWADRAIAEERALPAEREELIATYSVAAQDDIAHGAVTFSGAQTTRVERLQKLVAARPQHHLTAEQVQVHERQARLSNETGEPEARKPGEDPAELSKPMTPERRQELLSQTALGRTVAAAASNGTH